MARESRYDIRHSDSAVLLRVRDDSIGTSSSRAAQSTSTANRRWLGPSRSVSLDHSLRSFLYSLDDLPLLPLSGCGVLSLAALPCSLLNSSHTGVGIDVACLNVESPELEPSEFNHEVHGRRGTIGTKNNERWKPMKAVKPEDKHTRPLRYTYRCAEGRAQRRAEQRQRGWRFQMLTSGQQVTFISIHQHSTDGLWLLPSMVVPFHHQPPYLSCIARAHDYFSRASRASPPWSP